ncbi:MAG TPA: hypothetical protein VF997_20625 [Polyangia bacterium]
MRAWMAVLVAIVAGCGGAGRGAPSSTASDDPLAQPEAPLAAETLPGRLAGAWPLQIARGAGGWLLPWVDGGAVFARLVGDDGAGDDRLVDRGTLVGAAALADGFAVVVAESGVVRVHFLGSDGSDAVVATARAGDPVPGVASDGTRALVAATTGGGIAAEQPLPLDGALALVGRDGARTIELGSVAAAPTPWGDARGFIVSGLLLVDGSGVVAPAPGRQVRDARVFRKPIAAGTLPTSDTISLDGDGWLTVDGLVGWAGRDAGVARLELVAANGRALVEVGDDLTPRARRALPSTTRGDGGQSWIAAVAGEHVVWAATVENDPVFAILDASSMRARGGVVRIRFATCRTPIVSAGPVSVLLAWTEGASGAVRYALVPW